MRINVLGCRGSFPVEGAAFDRYGGATSSVSLSQNGRPSLLLDAGTGLRHLSRLTTQPFSGSLLLGHLHWDHIQGLPFAPLLDHEEASVDVYVPRQEVPARDLIARFMSPPTFPISPEGLKGRWRFFDLDPGRFEVEGFEVTAFEVPHKGGRTFGFRVHDGERSVAYISDHAPGPPGSGPLGLGLIDQTLISTIEGVDVLFHDSQHLDHEFPHRAYLGHTAVGYALDLGRQAEVGSLVLFHHDPARTDQDLDLISETLPAWAQPAHQGLTI